MISKQKQKMKKKQQNNGKNATFSGIGCLVKNVVSVCKEALWNDSTLSLPVVQLRSLLVTGLPYIICFQMDSNMYNIKKKMTNKDSTNFKNIIMKESQQHDENLFREKTHIT